MLAFGSLFAPSPTTRRRRRVVEYSNPFAPAGNNASFEVSIPEAAMLGIRTAGLFSELNNTDEVSEFLEELGLHCYVENFRSHGVTGHVLMSLSASEMRDRLGVTKLRDRRLITESVRYVSSALKKDSRASLPEDGRILTHLSNEVTVLAWARLSIVFLIVAVTSMRTDPAGLNITWSTVVGCSLCGMSVLAALHGARTFWVMYRVVEAGSPIANPGDPKVAATGALLGTIAVALFYTVMAQRAEEVSIILLVSI